MRASSSSEIACSSRSASSCTSSTCDAERLGEVELEQAVVADHLERDPLAAGVSVTPRYGACSASSSAASFFTIALADAGETSCARASAVTDDGLACSCPSL